MGLLDSRPAVAFYRAAFGNRSNKVIKLLPWTGIVVLLFLRCCLQFLWELAAGAALLAGVVGVLGWQASARYVLLPAGCALYCLLLRYLLAHPDANEGHRAGTEGYEGAVFENTIESLRELVARDRGPGGPLKGFPYVEIDVQDTRDGRVIVLHDTHLRRAFPRGAANDAAIAALERQGIRWGKCDVQDLTLEQLRALCLGGRPGCRVPTLAEFLDACRQLGLHRPLAVEVKHLHTQAAKDELLRLLGAYKPFADEQMSKYSANAYPPFGFLAVISFPFWFSRTFGEYGTAQWRAWARRFRAIGVPCRSCCCHALTLVHCPAASNA